jgi:hypothetical protein
MKLTTLLASSTLLFAFGCDSNDRPDPDGGVSPGQDGSATAQDASASGQDASASGQDAGAGLDAAAPAPDCDPSSLTNAGCGGDVSGRWVYRAACGEARFVETLRQGCPSLTVRATSHVVTGDLVFTGNNYTLDSSDVVDATVAFPASCAALVGGCAGVQALVRQGSGDNTATCAGAGECTCTTRTTIAAAQTGTFAINGGVLTTTPSQGAGASYNFCAESGALRYRETGDSVVFVLTR